MGGLRLIFAVFVLPAAVFLTSCSLFDDSIPETQIRRTREELESVIRSTVKDPDRASRLSALARESSERVQELLSLFGEFDRKLKAINEHPEMNGTERFFLQAFYGPALRRLRDEIMNILERMQSMATDDEWRMIGKYESKLLMAQANIR